MTGLLKEEGRLDKETQRRAPFEDGGRDWGDVSTSQGIPRVAISQQKVVESRKHPSREASERAGPLVSGFWPPELLEGEAFHD